jgi:ribose 5-phosphate isomerase B
MLLLVRSSMKILFGSDKLGYQLKCSIISHLAQQGYDCIDYGVAANEDIDYPLIAVKVGEALLANAGERGILVCGTGIGMAISANKLNGIYAAVCHDLYATQRSILSNNCNVMCLGALVIGERAALALVDEWLKLQYQVTGSQVKIDEIKEIEQHARHQPEH